MSNERERVAGVVTRFLVNEGYHNHIPTATKNGFDLADKIIEELSEELEKSWQCDELCD